MAATVSHISVCVRMSASVCMCSCACAHLKNLRRPLSPPVTQRHSSQLGQGGVSRKATIEMRLVRRVPVTHFALKS